MNQRRLLTLLERSGPVLSWHNLCGLMEDALVGDALDEGAAAAWRRALLYKGDVVSLGRAARGLYRNAMVQREPDPAEYLCAADPASFLVHYSALAYHGMTPRIPRDLHYAAHPWRATAVPLGFRPSLPPIPDHLISAPVRRFKVDAAAHIQELPQPSVGIVSRAWALILAVRKPALSGGWDHVEQVLRSHLPLYASEVVSILEEHGRPIDKVRFGYIIDELLQVPLPVLDHWSTFAQRGGSRILVAGKPFAPTYSERWCLSLNT